MERNPKALCGNCPYLNQEAGRCQHGPWRPRKNETDWCGQHPDFVLVCEDQAPYTPSPLEEPD